MKLITLLCTVLIFISCDDSFLDPTEVQKDEKLVNNNIEEEIVNLNSLYREYKDSDPYLALHYLKEQEQYAKTANDVLTLGKCYYNQGLILLNQEDYTESLNKYFRAVSCFESLEDQNKLAITFNDIAVVL